jgi:hypothetical protein
VFVRSVISSERALLGTIATPKTIELAAIKPSFKLRHFMWGDIGFIFEYITTLAIGNRKIAT